MVSSLDCCVGLKLFYHPVTNSVIKCPQTGNGKKEIDQVADPDGDLFFVQETGINWNALRWK